MSLYYEWAGTAGRPVLILSHSLGTNLSMWNPQLEALGHDFHLLLYDHPGHGNSTVLSTTENIADYGREVLALIDSLGIDHLSFCGLSLGGMVGIWLAAHAGHRFEKMVLCNTAAKIENTRLLRKRIKEIRLNGLAAITDSVIGKWFRPVFSNSHPAVIKQAKRMFLATGAEFYAMTAEIVCNLDLREDLSSIGTPTLVVYGEDDEATPPTWNIYIRDTIPGAESLSLPAAHLSNIEASASFNSSVLEFLVKQ